MVDRARIEYLAVIDIGSQETSLTISQAVDGGLPQVVESLSSTLALGVDSYTSGEISPQNITSLFKILQAFKLKLKEYPKPKLKVIATSALNEAKNKHFIQDQIEQAFKFDLDILSGNMETAYTYLAVRTKLADFDRLASEGLLLLNLGFGSIQLSLFGEEGLIANQNMLLGALRVRETLADLEKYSANYHTLLEEYISGDLAYYNSLRPADVNYRHLVVVGTGLDHWRRLWQLPVNGQVNLTRADFKLIYKQLFKGESPGLQEIKRLSPELASLVLPVSVLIHESFNMTGVQTAIIPDTSLDYGVQVSMLDGERGADYRALLENESLRSARQLAQRFQVDLDHNCEVERLALTLFDQLAPVHHLREGDRFVLQVAAILHNIGKYFNLQDNREISYSLVKSAEIIGLSPEQLDLTALLVRYHTGEMLEDDLYRKLPGSQQVRLAKLVSLLTMANALDVGHQAKVQDLQVKIKKKSVLIRVNHQADITLERWAFKKKMEFFIRVFGRTIKLQTVV